MLEMNENVAMFKEGLLNNESLLYACRLCLNVSVDNVYIFSSDGQKLSLKEKVGKYFSIWVQIEDALPKTVCQQCIGKIEHFSYFYTKVEKVQQNIEETIACSSNGVKFFNDCIKLEDDWSPDITKCSISEIKLENNEPDIFDAEREINGTDDNSHVVKEERETFADPDSDYSHSIGSSIASDDHNDLEIQKKEGNSYNSERISNSVALLRHKKVHSLMCRICNKTYANVSAFEQHLKAHGSDPTCAQCGQMFRNKNSMRRHMYLHNDSFFCCSQCHKVFKTADSRRKHFLCHKDLWPYKCAVCNKLFKRKTGLEAHVVVHTGEKPFQCPYCPRTFASKSNYYTHKLRLHNSSTTTG